MYDGTQQMRVFASVLALKLGTVKHTSLPILRSVIFALCQKITRGGHNRDVAITGYIPLLIRHQGPHIQINNSTVKLGGQNYFMIASGRGGLDKKKIVWGVWVGNAPQGRYGENTVFFD